MTEYNPPLFGTLAANVPAVAGSCYGWMVLYDGSGNAPLAIIGTAGKPTRAAA